MELPQHEVRVSGNTRSVTTYCAVSREANEAAGSCGLISSNLVDFMSNSMKGVKYTAHYYYSKRKPTT